MNYDKHRFVDNVYYWARKRDRRIGDLEYTCGVSSGYLSRLRQGAKNVAPGADFLMAVSEYLTVSIDALLSFDFSQATDAEQTVKMFLDNLADDTREHRLLWKEDQDPALRSVPLFAEDAEPLFFVAVSPDDSGAPERRVYYRSLFRDDRPELVVEHAWVCAREDGRRFYLMKAWFEDEEGNRVWWDLDLVSMEPYGETLLPLAHLQRGKPTRLDGSMRLLLATVEDSITLPHLTPAALSMMQDYLQERS